MKNILYIGNKLNNKNSNLSSICVLGPRLEQEGYTLRYASTYPNKIIRMLDMVWHCFKYRKSTDIVIMDTYSTLNFYYALLISQLCRILKLKYVSSLNGGNLPMRLKKNPRFCRAIFAHAYKLVSPSVYLKEAFEAHGYQKVTYIPNSLNLEQYN